MRLQLWTNCPAKKWDNPVLRTVEVLATPKIFTNFMIHPSLQQVLGGIMHTCALCPEAFFLFKYRYGESPRSITLRVNYGVKTLLSKYRVWDSPGHTTGRQVE
ncbi:MAG: hypothetical protein COZ87_00675 [Candidatus Moranbacteria bacterium CG_4_8_14_3_um_filter_43_15]|nr:MAG: hypothetical protein COW51_02165 [Candidatus Moranbacteria bacterium CG17_big_fil_post_rev_8_21_14_2_50_44_12]PIW93545.1 MAG: hypothetical protein COZ87_00675 [Candidatus Moranbacteria bacterium CG_4_8_14_3_um_filter_43_15]